MDFTSRTTLADEFMKNHESGLIGARESDVRVSVPSELCEDTARISAWFDRAYESIRPMESKPTTKG